MMCYRDRTYCDAPCSTERCPRQITAEVEAAANRAGLPIAISDLRDGCRDYRPPSVEGGEGER
jgi:hypothetical protein